MALRISSLFGHSVFRRFGVSASVHTDSRATPPKSPNEKELYKNEAQYKGWVDEQVPDDVKDLSTIAHPTGKLFGALPPSMLSAAYVSSLMLPKPRVEEFWKNGFISNVRVLSEQQCDLLLDELTQLSPPNKHRGHGLFHEYHANQSGDPNNVLLHALGHWRITEGFHDLIYLPAITVPTAQLLKEEQGLSSVRFWHDQLFAKPPFKGGNVAWHQDYSYWTRTGPMAHMTVHIALDDQTVENGAIMYIPGSHRWTRNGGRPLPITADDFGDMESIKKILTEEEKSAFTPVASTLKKGEASFHHPLSVHGSFTNRSSRPRRAAVLNYFADGTVCLSADPLLKGVPRFEVGSKLQGQFFPLVLDVTKIFN